jgi:copper chaperone
MITFTVNDMTCSHCAGSITKAVKALDSNATVNVRLDSKRVEIGSTQTAEALAEAITEAGYTPVPVQD